MRWTKHIPNNFNHRTSIFGNACFYKIFIINLNLQPVSKVLSLFSFCCLLLTTYQIPTILRMTAIFLFCLQQIDQNKTKPQEDSLWLLLSHVCSGVRTNLKSYQNFSCVSLLFHYIDNLLTNLMMSSRWNFPARAKPSYEGSEPSQAQLGTSIFELKLSWQYVHH